MMSAARFRKGLTSGKVKAMADYTQGPDYTALRLAQAILNRETDGTPFPVDIIRAARETTDWAASALRRDEAIRKAAQEKQAQIDAVLDSDVPTPGMPCGHRVYTGNHDYRGHDCGRTTSVLRTWTTSETAGWELDGQPLPPFVSWSDLRIPGGWELGKGFVERELTAEEQERVKTVRKTVTHTATLCGTHRRLRGQYGLPY